MGSNRFDGKVALVTGGASGIGLEITTRLLAEGAHVVVGDINEAQLGVVAEQHGDGVTTVTANVRSEDDIVDLVQRAVAHSGRLDVAFNVAGAGALGPILTGATADWNSVIATTLTGTFLSLTHEARHMATSGGGAIVNISSINSFQAVHGSASYCAAKAGVAMLTKSAALELGEAKIRVNAVAPGLIDTPMTAFQRDIPAIREAFLDVIPLARVGRTSDIASAALFLASDEAEWITGTELVVDGGQTLTGYPNLTKLLADAGFMEYAAHVGDAAGND